MKRIELTLEVVLKGADLFASTATLTLRDKMGLGETLAGLRRLDRYRFVVETPADAASTLAALQRVFDRRSTFYNRNKHDYALSAQWDGGEFESGAGSAALRARWSAAVSAAARRDRGVYVVELAVRDDDVDALAGFGAKVQADLRAGAGPADVVVACTEATTVWWLALVAADGQQARREAEAIAITRARDRGLLANPNYQSVEVGPAVMLAAVSE